MQSDMGITGELLDAVGRLSGLTFRLLPPGDPPADTVPSPATLQALRDEAVRAGGPCSRQAADGRWLGGVVVPIDGQARLLYSCTERQEAAPDGFRQSTLAVLQCIRRLAEEREAKEGESRQLVEELNKTYEDLHLFARIATQIRSLHYSEQMLQALLEETRDAMRVDLVAALFETGYTSDITATCRGLEDVLPEPHSFLAALRTEMTRSAPVFERDCLIVADSSKAAPFASLHTRPFRALAVAIHNGERKYGQLLLVSFAMQEVFRRGEYRLLGTMAEQLALVMANTDLYRDLEMFVIGLVQSFVTAIEAKDRYTKGHSERVCRLCMWMGDAMKLDHRQSSALQWASVLHDVGKIGTAETILNKPAELTAGEYDIVKKHPVKGAQILKPIAQLADALPAIRHHHERYDGKGYPDGLAGEEIPLLARIIAVADAYDAMTSTRAYRPGRSHAEAMRALHACVGTQFDPFVVAVFSAVIEQKTRTHDDTRRAPRPSLRPEAVGPPGQVTGAPLAPARSGMLLCLWSLSFS